MPKKALKIVPKDIRTSEERIRDNVEQALAHQLERIPLIVEDIIRKSICGLLGITTRYGECRFSSEHDAFPMARYVREKLVACAKEIIDPIVEKTFHEMVTSPDFYKEIIEAQVATHKQQIKYVIERQLRNMSEKWNKEIEKSLDQKVSEQIAKAITVNTNLLDPEAFKGVLGEIIFNHEMMMMDKGVIEAIRE